MQKYEKIKYKTRVGPNYFSFIFEINIEARQRGSASPRHLDNPMRIKHQNSLYLIYILL